MSVKKRKEEGTSFYEKMKQFVCDNTALKQTFLFNDQNSPRTWNNQHVKI